MNMHDDDFDFNLVMRMMLIMRGKKMKRKVVSCA
jgi:hypothetical protein